MAVRREEKWYSTILRVICLYLCTPCTECNLLTLYVLVHRVNCQRMSSYSRQSSTSSNVSTAGTSSFQVGRERQRQPEMELFRWVLLLTFDHLTRFFSFSSTNGICILNYSFTQDSQSQIELFGDSFFGQWVHNALPQYFAWKVILSPGPKNMYT